MQSRKQSGQYISQNSLVNCLCIHLNGNVKYCKYDMYCIVNTTKKSLCYALGVLKYINLRIFIKSDWYEDWLAIKHDTKQQPSHPNLLIISKSIKPSTVQN